MADALLPMGFMSLVGLEFDSDADGVAVSVELGDEHMNPNGIVHGGVTYTLIDTAMGSATMTVADEDHRCATAEIHVRYHRAARGGRLTATSTVISRAARLVHLDARVVDGEGELIATATGSYSLTDLKR